MAKKKDKNWIQKASASIKKRGTKGVCTGPKFGGPSCPPGSRRYNLAKVFRGMASKRKNAAEGAMIHAKNSKYIQRAKDRHPPLSADDKNRELYERARKNKKKDRITVKDLKKDDSWKYRTGPIRIDKRFMFNKRFLKQDPRMLRQGGMLKAQTGELVREKTRGTGAAVTGDTHVVMQGMDAAQTGKLIQVPTRGSGAAVTGNQHYVMEGMDAAKHGKIIKAKTSSFAANPDAWKKARGASTTGMKVAGAGTAYTSPGWTTKINKSLNKLKGMMKLGTKTTAMRAGVINPSKWSSVPKASQLGKLKTLARVGGSRATWLIGGPMGAAAAAATLTPSLIDKLTKRAPGATKTKLFGIDIKGAEKSARTREALMAKRNKARGYKSGAEIIAPSSDFVIRPKPTSGGTVLEQKPINDYTKDLL